VRRKGYARECRTYSDGRGVKLVSQLKRVAMGNSDQDGNLEPMMEQAERRSVCESGSVGAIRGFLGTGSRDP
jgi:hypothetical protein